MASFTILTAPSDLSLAFMIRVLTTSTGEHLFKFSMGRRRSHDSYIVVATKPAMKEAVKWVVSVSLNPRYLSKKLLNMS